VGASWWRRATDGLRERAVGSGLVGRLTIPLVLAGFALLVGGFWLGEDAGVSPTSASVVTLVTKGRVVTIHGVTTVRVPARTVRVKGRRIRIPAQTLTLRGPARTLVEAVDRTSTVNRTSTVQSTVVRTGPTSTVITTVTGPTTTQTSTETDTVTTTVTVTTTT
jgi:hypothetical protein